MIIWKEEIKKPLFGSSSLEECQFLRLFNSQCVWSDRLCWLCAVQCSAARGMGELEHGKELSLGRRSRQQHLEVVLGGLHRYSFLEIGKLFPLVVLGYLTRRSIG